MPKPPDTLWELDPHSKGKHVILRRYLDAWLPIMSTYNRRLLLVDGFAGPGRYLGGEPGSPLIMLQAFLEHAYQARISAELVYLFIEERADRVDHLRDEISKLKLPPTIKFEVVCGKYQEEFEKRLKALQEVGRSLAPAFVFIDPFGYSDAPMTLTGRFLAFSKCEVLIYLPLPFIARFVSRSGQEEALDSLFGTDCWREAIKLDGDARVRFLHDLFRDQLVASGVTFVRSFEVRTSTGHGYHLFFGTNSVVGLEKMKDAMWTADAVAGASFRDSTDNNQLVLFEPEVDTAPLLRSLREKFAEGAFTIEQAESATLLETPYLPSRHLKRKTLKPAELAGALKVVSERKQRGTYPPGTVMRFVRPA